MQAQRSRNRLRALRLSKGLKLYDIAAELRVDTSTVWRWEAEVSSIPDEHKPNLAALLDVSIEHLMCWDDTSPSSGKGIAA